MTFIPFLAEKKTKVYENILKFRTLNHTIRTWVERTASGPNEGEDFLAINDYIATRRQAFDTQPTIDTAEELCKQFPRICAIEVLNGYGNEGVLIYPRWP